MKRIALHTLAMLGMAFSLNLQASTTWVPISVGDITTFIPYVPNGSLLAPENVQISFNGSQSTLVWDDVEHASQYEVLGLNVDGEWVSITTTSLTFIIIDGNLADFSSIKVIACGLTSCDSSGFSSSSIDMDIAEGASWQANRVFEGDDAVFSWRITGGSACVNELGNSVGSIGRIHQTTSAQTTIKKTITCNGNSFSDTLAVLANPSITLPVAIANPINESFSTVVGSTPDNFSVGAMGNASYTMPIATAPGAGGLVPDMSLRYDSGSNNGLLGVGWSIGGISVLSKCAKTIVDDNEIGTLDNKERLCLDGKKLIATSGEYWAVNTEYQLVDKTPMKIVASTSQTYTVSMPNGMVFTYSHDIGGSSNAWPLTKQQDPAGNYILFNYTDGRYLQLSSIQYTGNENAGISPNNAIFFKYKERDDVIYRRDDLDTTFRLDAVESRVNVTNIYSGDGDELRSYNIQYKYADVSGRSLIENITSCADGTCLAPTTFAWQEGNLLFNAIKDVKIHSNSDSKGQRALDADGDGITDFWLLKNDSGTSSDDIRVVQGGSSPTLVQVKDHGATKSFRDTWQVIDFDHDGRDDVMYENAGWKIYRSTVVDNNPTTINYDFASPILTNIPAHVKDLRIADFNADGYADILYYDDLELYIHYNIYAENNGAAVFGVAVNVTPGELTDSFPLSTDYKRTFFSNNNPIEKNIQVGDIDGDGISEIVFAIPESRDNQCNYTSTNDENKKVYRGKWRVFTLGQNGFSQTRVIGDWESINVQTCSGYYNFSPEEVLTRVQMVDINQDGLSDIISEHFSSTFPPGFLVSSSNISVTLKMNIEKGLLSEPSFLGLFQGTVGEYTSSKYRYLFSDHNSDGYLDLIYYINAQYNTNGSEEVWRVAHYNGDDFENSTYTNIKYSFNDQGINTFVEINGDGVPDYISFEGHLNFQISQSDKRDLLTSITNGFEQTTTIKYKSLSDENAGTFYTRENNADELTDIRCQSNGYFCSPIIDVEIPIHVVQNVIIDQESSTTYKYKGLKAQLGVGLLGFSEVVATESKSGTRITSNYHQAYPYTGKLYHTTTERSVTLAQQTCEEFFGSEFCYDVKDYVFLSSTDISYAQYEGSFCATEGGPCATLNGKYVYPETITKNTYDVDSGALQSIMKTINTIPDDYGHMRTVTKISNNGISDVATVVTRKVYGHSEAVYGGRLTSKRITTSRPGKSTVTQAVTYAYNPSNNYLLASKEIDNANNLGSAPNDSLSENFNSKETYTRDDFGNVILLVNTGASATAQATGYVYDSYGRYLTEQHQYLGYSSGQSLTQTLALLSINTSTTYDAILGLPLTITSTNGQVTTNGYNALGRLNYTYNPDGSYATVTQALCATSYDCPTTGYYVETTSVSNGPNSKVYFDNKGLKLREKTQTLADAESGTIAWIQKDYAYDYLNRKIIESVPHFSGELIALGSASSYSEVNLPPLGYSYTVFDELNRVTSLFKPDHGHWQTSYNGLTSISTNPEYMITTTVKNVLGEVTSVTDADSNQVTYNYNALGQMRLVSRVGDTGAVATEIKFDHLGRKIKMIDPDVGIVQYRYDGFGNLLWQQDAKNQRKCTIYDEVGRVKERFEVKTATCAQTASLDSHIEYTYDSSMYGLGLVSSIYDHINDIDKQYDYNALSLVYRETTTLEGKNYFQDTVFDSTNQFRVKTVYDASRGDSGIEYQYNSINYLVSKKDLASNIKIWQLLKTDAWGNATEFTYGGVNAGDTGITTTKAYNAYDGTLMTIMAGNGSIQNNEYHFTTVGNLKYRKDKISLFEEQFGYDSLNRLDDWSKTGGGATGSIDVNYDSLGNISYKTGVGTYHYNNKPHAVSSITSGNLAGSFAYDANGNMTSGGGRGQITYNVNNKPTYISASGHITEFVYSIGGARIKRTDTEGSQTKETLYVGNVEFVSENGKLNRIQRTIEGFAIETYFANTGITNLEYLHFDHLGSAEVITRTNGTVIQRFSFDPWGQRRSVDNYNTTYGFIDGLSLSLNYYNKGFTGHEHMDESGLIHMNGRIYDPRLGRFLNADPMVQQEYNLQNLNRYSYVLNNPLNATDPSGYSFTVLFKLAAEYFASASFAQSIAMAAVSYASNGSIQFTYSSADAFSYGQGAQRSLESQLFDSYDLGGNGAYGLDQAKAQAQLGSATVTSGVSGIDKAGSMQPKDKSDKAYGPGRSNNTKRITENRRQKMLKTGYAGDGNKLSIPDAKWWHENAGGRTLGVDGREIHVTDNLLFGEVPFGFESFMNGDVGISNFMVHGHTNTSSINGISTGRVHDGAYDFEQHIYGDNWIKNIGTYIRNEATSHAAKSHQRGTDYKIQYMYPTQDRWKNRETINAQK